MAQKCLVGACKILHSFPWVVIELDMARSPSVPLNQFPLIFLYFFPSLGSVVSNKWNSGEARMLMIQIINREFN